MNPNRAISACCATALTAAVLATATPAAAAETVGVTNLAVAGQALGPHAGYLGLSSGQLGRTALFAVTTPSPAATLTGATLSIVDEDRRLSITADFAADDGFALYAEHDAVAGFGPDDLARGPLTSGFTVTGVAGAAISVRLNFPAAVTGYAKYYVVAHPSTRERVPQRLVVVVPTGGLTGSFGTAPAADVSTPERSSGDDARIVVKTQRPSSLAPARFAPRSNPAGQEDEYDIDVTGLSGAQASPLTVVFFNALATRDENAILRRPAEGSRAVHPLLPEGGGTVHRVAIGDGTGITATQRVARNNQLSNAVFAAVLDDAGNLSSTTALRQCPPDGPTSECDTSRGNPVVGPPAPTSVHWGDGTPVGDIRGINRTNRAQVPVYVESPAGAASLPPGADPNTTAAAFDTRVQIVGAGAGGTPSGAGAPPKLLRAGQGNQWDATAHTTVTSDAGQVGDVTFPGVADGANAVATAVNLDAHGNASDLAWTAVGKRKDVTPPTLSITTSSSAQLPTPNTMFRVQFSEPMSTSSISESTSLTPTATGTSAEQCTAQGTSASRVDLRLPPRSTTSPTPTRTWGSNPCFHWAADGASATLKLGDPPLDGTTLAHLGDVVTPDPAVTDLVGNRAVADPAVPDLPGNIVISPTGPYPLSARTRDGDRDGLLDSLVVTFSASLDASNFDQIEQAFVADGSLDGRGSIPVLGMSLVAGTPEAVTFSIDEEFTSGVRPSLRMVQQVEFRSTIGQLVAPFAIRAVDAAAPRPIDVVYTDEAPVDGYTDTLRVRYSEPIDHSRDNNAGYSASPYVTSAAEPASGPATDSKLIRLTRAPSQTPHPYDTGAEVTLRYDALATVSPVPGAPYDTAEPSGNRMDCVTGEPDPCYTMAARDGAPPVAVARYVRDLDLDGRIDAIDVVYSEPLSTVSVLSAQFSVAGRQLLDQRPFGPSTVRLVVEELPDLRGDTEATPNVSYLGGLQDPEGNAAPAATMSVTDAAGPAIVAACVRSSVARATTHCPNGPDGTLVRVTLSEPVDVTTVAAADFVVEQPAGTLTTPTAVSVSADGRSVGLTLPAGRVTPTADALVRFANGDAVRDRSEPDGNPNAQVAAVTAFAVPTVTLSLECTQTAPPGYCAGRTVTVTTSGSSGIVGWRFATTPGGTEPPESEFTPTPPPWSFTFPSEGRYTLFLAGIDLYGRVSQEVQASMMALDDPSISGVTLVNSGTRPSTQWSAQTTVRDGDLVRIVATARGADAAEWVDSAGRCLVAHMSANLTALSGRAEDTRTAPATCTLKSAVSREMQFGLRQVTGTTRYPVGTVLRTSTSDPGHLVADRADGTQYRRRFVSANARRSWQISDASVITVPTAALASIPVGPSLSYREGALLRAPNGSHYVMSEGKRHWVSRKTLSYWRMPLTTAYRISTGEFNATPAGPSFGAGRHPVGVWIKSSNGTIQRIVRNAAGAVVRRTLGSTAALRTLVPSTHVYPANSYDTRLPVDSWLVGYRDGTLLRRGDGSYAVVARGSLRSFANPATFNTLGYNTSNAVTANRNAMPRVAGSAYRTGAPIDRYKVTSVVIDVVNKVDGKARETVLPQYGGLYALGTPDPVPAGWDFTR